MNGEFSGEVPELGSGRSCMSMLRGLGRDEILEVLSEGLCQNCEPALLARVQALNNRKLSEMSVSKSKRTENSSKFLSADSASLGLSEKRTESSNKSTSWGTTQTPESVYSGRSKGFIESSSPASVNGKKSSNERSGSRILLNDGLSDTSSLVNGGMSEEQERSRFSQVGRKEDFVYIERIDGRPTNVLKGLELHTQVFNTEEQKKIVDCVYDLQRKGQNGQMRARTYSEPRKWMRGKGRVTIQFGCCYNYAVDKNGNPPGIVQDEEVDPLPPLFKEMIKRMVRWKVLPPTCVPDSCIVNIYDEGDCIPPHIDHHDFLRPFCTVSFLTQCNILFGANIKILSPGEFAGPVSIPLPVGSVLILNGNGADVAKHCVPGVPGKRISITFRKMDDSKLPFKFAPYPDLLGIKPLVYHRLNRSPVQQNHHEDKTGSRSESPVVAETSTKSFLAEKDDFPPLKSLSYGSRRQKW